MALLLSSTPQRKILIQGTDLEISQVYLRLFFTARIDGIALDINATTYASKNAFLEGAPVSVDIVSPQVTKNIDPATQQQGLDSAHTLLKAHFEENGYTVAIDLS